MPSGPAGTGTARYTPSASSAGSGTVYRGQPQASSGRPMGRECPSHTAAGPGTSWTDAPQRSSRTPNRGCPVDTCSCRSSPARTVSGQA